MTIEERLERLEHRNRGLAISLIVLATLLTGAVGYLLRAGQAQAGSELLQPSA